ncbi:MAG: hypothetical protein H7235_09770 [Bdellovibrionaceae bacterium]|nr:hypothetical protein [Pseudobdellovibrionaceae bacterium]
MNQFGTVDKYLKACDRISRDGYEARLYQSSDLAMYDLVQSLIHFMPHKNKIAVISRGSHLVDVVTSLALKNQNQIIYKKENENTATFLETLGNNVHFVYWVVENEVTGEVYYSSSQCEEMRSILNRKKIFSLQVTSRPTLSPQLYPLDTASYTLLLQAPNIFKFDQEAAAVYFSEKQKIPFGLATIQEMGREGSFIHLPVASSLENDRLLVSCEKALQVKEYLKLTTKDAFVANEFPSWVTDKWSTWWPEIIQLSVLQGTLILSAEYVAVNPDYADQIKHAQTHIKQLSGWKI